MQIPRFAEYSHRRSSGFHQSFQVRACRGLSMLLARAAECRQPGILKFDVFRHLEETEVFRIRARPAAFDIMEVSFIEALSNAQFFFCRKINLLALCTVSQSCVVN